MVVRYSHQNGEHIRAAMDKLDKRYRPSASGGLHDTITQELHRRPITPPATDNPVKKLSQTRAWYRVERRRTVLKPHQIAPFMQAVLALENALARDYFLLVLLTGLRRQEALDLRWEQVDLTYQTLTIIDPKNRQDHTLPLSDYLLEMLARRKA